MMYLLKKEKEKVFLAVWLLEGALELTYQLFEELSILIK